MKKMERRFRCRIRKICFNPLFLFLINNDFMKYTLLIPVLIIVLISCDKNEDPPAGPTKTELITSSTWKYESGGGDQNGDGTIDFTFEQSGVVQPCRLDNTATFQANGTGITDEGATKCNAADPQTSPFDWNFLNNESEINVTGSGFFGVGGKFKLKTLTSTAMTVTKDTVISMNGIPFPVTVIANLKH
jgi:hypothetical protein